MTIPNPGSREAVALGCKCPRMDNAHGRGAYEMPDGTPIFYINDDCPLHGHPQPKTASPSERR